MAEPTDPDEVIDNVVDDTTTPEEEDEEMAATERAAESMEHVVVTSAQGHAFVMEGQRINMLEGKIGYREGLTHRIIGESGGGQARAHLPAGQGGVPTSG